MCKKGTAITQAGATSDYYFNLMQSKKTQIGVRESGRK